VSTVISCSILLQKGNDFVEDLKEEFVLLEYNTEVQRKSVSTSKEYISSIFRVKEQARQEINVNQATDTANQVQKA
jgi:hypothetical protein